MGDTSGGGRHRGGGEAMRWLILPDIHDKLRRAKQIIEREPHDRLLFMGDFFDDFRTGVTDAADTASQVKLWLNSPNTTSSWAGVSAAPVIRGLGVFAGWIGMNWSQSPA